jgi:SAM-dependent methyltransferase
MIKTRRIILSLRRRLRAWLARRDPLQRSPVLNELRQAPSSLPQTQTSNITNRPRNMSDLSAWLESAYQQPGAQLSKNADGSWSLTTPDGQWHYALTLSINAVSSHPQNSDICARLRLQVSTGSIGVGLVNTSGSDYVSNEEQIEADTQIHTVTLAPDRNAIWGALIIRNVSDAGSSSCVIHDLSAVSADQVPPAEYLTARSNRFSTKKWMYAFDLGHGVVTKTFKDGQQEFINLHSAVVFDLIKSYVGSCAGLRCLDAACSSGFFSFALAEMGFESVYAFDMDAQSIAQAKFVQECKVKPEHARIQFTTQDLLAFEPPSDKFDVVVCTGTLQSVSDILGATRKIFECTRRWAFIHSVTSEMEGPVLELSCQLGGVPCLLPSKMVLVDMFTLAGFKKIDTHLPQDGKFQSLLQKCSNSYYRRIYERNSVYLVMEK